MQVQDKYRCKACTCAGAGAGVCAGINVRAGAGGFIHAGAGACYPGCTVSSMAVGEMLGRQARSVRESTCTVQVKDSGQWTSP